MDAALFLVVLGLQVPTPDAQVDALLKAGFQRQVGNESGVLESVTKRLDVTDLGPVTLTGFSEDGRVGLSMVRTQLGSVELLQRLAAWGCKTSTTAGTACWRDAPERRLRVCGRSVVIWQGQTPQTLHGVALACELAGKDEAREPMTRGSATGSGSN